MIDKLDHYAFTAPGSIYDEEALTALELAARTAEKTNECITAFNEHEKVCGEKLSEAEKFMRDNIKESIEHTLGELIEAGEITGILDSNIMQSVKHFGAKGDGVTDDTEAVQAAINSGATQIFFPAGVYLIKNILLPSNIVLLGEGVNSILKQSDEASEHFIMSPDFRQFATGATRDLTTGAIVNTRIEKLRLEGAKVNGLHGIAIYGYNLVLSDLEVSSFGGVGVYLESPGDIHSSPSQNLQNDLKDIVVCHCLGGNYFYNGQSDSILTNIMGYYGGAGEGYENTVNITFGSKAWGCKLNGGHFWGECKTHVLVNAGGETFTNLHAEGAYTQIEINERYNTITGEIYDPIHAETKDSVGVKFGQNAGNVYMQLTSRDIFTVFDYQGHSPTGHIIMAQVSTPYNGIAFTNYPYKPFIQCNHFDSVAHKQIWRTPYMTMRDGWCGFDTQTPIKFDIDGKNVFTMEKVDNITSNVSVCAGDSVRGPQVKVTGTETNADLQLVPKGEGKVRFGTYTAATGEVNGYIEIKDSTGTVRKLACI